MADLTVNITETITLEGQTQAETQTQTISNISNVDTRILVCATGSWTTLFYFNPAELPTGSATFSTGSFRYGRVTNLSNTTVKLNVQTYSESVTRNSEYTLTSDSSFLLASTIGSINTDSTPSPIVYNFDQYVYSILATPSGSNASIEYYIATT
jgi:hypothetical protein